MSVGPISEAIVTMITTTNPKTASLFFSRRRHASRHNEVPRTNPSSDRTSASAIAISDGIWIRSSSLFLSVAILVIPDSRIEKRVDNVNQQIHQQQRYGNECDDSDNERLVAIQRCLDEVVS